MSKFDRRDGGQDGYTNIAETPEEAVVRAMYRALEVGDDAAFARCVHPSIEWIDPVVARLPFDGTRHGPSAVLSSAFRRGADGTGPLVLAGTFLEFGDGVLVAGRLVGEGRRVGQAERPFLHECFVRGGRVARIREYPV